MTQKHVQVSAYAVLLILGVSTAWAETKKEGNRELLPPPKGCCENAGVAVPKCCAEAGECAACAKQTRHFTSKSAKECDIERRLNAICPLDFKDTPLSQILDDLRTMTGLNIVTDVPALNEAGISIDHPVTLKVEGVALKNSLNLLLHQLHLSSVVKDEVLMVTTEEQARGKLVNKIYPVGNLVFSSLPANLAACDGPIDAAEFPIGFFQEQQEDAPEDTLLKLIMESIEPATWSDNGGPGTMNYFPPGKTLVVHQTADVQERIADLLAALRRSVEEQVSTRGPAFFPNLPVPPPAPFAQLPPYSSFTVPTLMPHPYDQPPPPTPAQPLPPIPFANGPLPPPCPLPGLMQPPAPCPVPAAQATPAPRAYVLKVEMSQRSPDENAINCQRQEIAFVAGQAPFYYGGIVTAEEAGKEHRKGLLQVKATVLKNERVRVELVEVQGKAEKTSNGRVALDLAVRPLVDRKVKLGKTVKVIIDREEGGAPHKWVALTLDRIPEPAEHAPVALQPIPHYPPHCFEAFGTQVCGPVYPPPPAVCCPVPAPSPSTPSFVTAPMPCQLASCVSLPAAAVLPSITVRPQHPSSQPWRLRAITEDGKTRLASQTFSQAMSCESIEIRIAGGDILRLTAAGKQIQAKAPSLQASADEVSNTGQDSCFVFEGHVNLTYQKEGQHAQVIANRVLVNLVDGRLEIQSAPAPSQPMPPSFWHGFFH